MVAMIDPGRGNYDVSMLLSPESADERQKQLYLIIIKTLEVSMKLTCRSCDLLHEFLNYTLRLYLAQAPPTITRYTLVRDLGWNQLDYLELWICPRCSHVWSPNSPAGKHNHFLYLADPLRDGLHCTHRPVHGASKRECNANVVKLVGLASGKTIPRPFIRMPYFPIRHSIARLLKVCSVCPRLLLTQSWCRIRASNPS